MPRDYKPAENERRAKARRQHALDRRELREPSAPRQAPAGATSFPVKARDEATSAAITAFLSRGTKGDKID
jgi:hypothetical protein